MTSAKTICGRRVGVVLILLTTTGCGVRQQIAALVPDDPERRRVLEDDGFDLTTNSTTPTIKPPNPNRQNPFQFPQEQLTANEEQAEATPQLLGFVNVDGPQAILRVGGLVNPYREGQEFGEFTLVRIDPPSITLRRGELEWSASLFGASD